MSKSFIIGILLSLTLTSCSWNPFQEKEKPVATEEVSTEAAIETASEPAEELDKKSSANTSSTTSGSGSKTKSSQSSTTPTSSTPTPASTSTSMSTSSTGATATSTASTTSNAALPSTKSFTVTAKKWSFSPSTITVNKGDTVKLTVISSDVSHGFFIPDFNVNATISAGKSTSLTFLANKTGSFSFSCSVYCGDGHGGMSGTLIVK